MKKLTFISIGVVILGFVLQFIANNLTKGEVLWDLGHIMTSLGFLLVYVFSIAWSAELGRSNVIITSVFFALFFCSFLIYGFIKADEAEKRAEESYLQMIESQEDRQRLEMELDSAYQRIEILESEIDECKGKVNI